MKKLFWFGSGLLVGLTCLTVALGSVPSGVTDDTLIYDNLREIEVLKERDLNFDGDIARLATLEKYYQEESLPSLRKRRIQAPADRIGRMKYRPSSGALAKRQSKRVK